MRKTRTRNASERHKKPTTGVFGPGQGRRAGSPVAEYRRAGRARAARLAPHARPRSCMHPNKLRAGRGPYLRAGRARAAGWAARLAPHARPGSTHAHEPGRAGRIRAQTWRDRSGPIFVKAWSNYASRGACRGSHDDNCDRMGDGPGDIPRRAGGYPPSCRGIAPVTSPPTPRPPVPTRDNGP